MLSFFSSPDLSKFRGKSKKVEPAVKLKHVMWNSELKLQHGGDKATTATSPASYQGMYVR